MGTDESSGWSEREHGFSDQLEAEEALMWRLESDPWLNPSGAAIALLDRPVDVDDLRKRLEAACVSIPRLRERVVEHGAELLWRTDTDFDIDRHIVVTKLTGERDRREVFDLAAEIYRTPYDREHPLWQFTVIDGLADGTGALVYKLHHSISDGIGAVRMAEAFMGLTRDWPLPEPVNLRQTIAESIVAEPPLDKGPSSARALINSVGSAAKVARDAVGEVAMWGADPRRAMRTMQQSARQATRSARAVGDVVAGRSTADLLDGRSGDRRVEAVSFDLDDAKAAAKQLDGSLNDFFVGGLLDALQRYHLDIEAPVPGFNFSFVVSLRNDDAMGGNHFTPIRVRAEAGQRTPEERVADAGQAMRAAAEQLDESIGLGDLAAMTTFVPTSVLSRLGRDMGAQVDLVTSNFQAPPFTVFISGAELVEVYTLGPLAGAAMNATLMSYDGTVFIGLFLDPAAITEPERFAACVDAAYADLLGD